MSVLDVDGFEQRLQAYAIERSEEARAVRVGEKETSEQAAIVARYADLFTREQLTALEAAEEEASESEREAVARLRLTCQEGIVTAALAEREDELENALLAARVAWDGEQLPIRSAQAGLAVEPDYARRAALGEAVLAVSSGFNDQRRRSPTATSSSRTSRGSTSRSPATRRRRACSSARSSGQSTARESRAPASRPSASAGSTACSGPSATRPRPVRTWPGSGGSLRWKPRTRRTGAWPSASRPCGVSASTSSREGHPHGPRGPSPEVASCLRDRLRPAARCT